MLFCFHNSLKNISLTLAVKVTSTELFFTSQQFQDKQISNQSGLFRYCVFLDQNSWIKTCEQEMFQLQDSIVMFKIFRDKNNAT